MERYKRQIALPEIGISGQKKLSDAKVLVIGAGGLGCPVLQQLAAAGVGTLGIVDGDVVEKTNLHRQILYALPDCGKNKATVAAQALLKLNPEVNAIPFPDYFTENNANTITENFGIIVDCTDTLAARYLINDIALAKNIPVVYASVHKFEGQVSVFNYLNGPSYRCLFPENKTKTPAPNCTATGVLGVLPNTLGMFQATETMKIILGIGEVLSGKVLVYDALTGNTQIIAFPKNTAEIKIGRNKGALLLTQTDTKKTEHLNVTAFLSKTNNPDCLLIDIREEYEEPRLTYQNLVNVPLAVLDNFMRQLDTDQEIVVCCQSGQRSANALHYLKQNGFKKVSHLKNGIRSIPNQ